MSDSVAAPGQTWGESAEAAAAKDILASEGQLPDEAAGAGAATGGAAGADASGRAVTEESVPQGAVHGDGSRNCPDGYPLKGNASSLIYHMPGQSSYDATEPEYCFATEEDATAAGYRPRKGGGRSIGDEEAAGASEDDAAASAAMSIGAERPAVERTSMAAGARASGTAESEHAESDTDVAAASTPDREELSKGSEIGSASGERGGMTGSMKADGGGQCPSEYPIKGNASSKIFHVPDQSSYRGTKAEFCFASEADAVAAGYRPRSGGRPATASSHEDGAGGVVSAHERVSASDQAASETSYGLAATEAVARADLAESSAEIEGSDGSADGLSGSAVPAGAVAGNGTRECPNGYPIKGNGNSLIFHVPTGSSYDVTEPEYCFASEDDALAAGYRASKR